MKNLYLVSEEFLTPQNIQIALTKHCENSDTPFTVTSISTQQTGINTYKVHGFNALGISSIEIIVGRGGGSFVDLLVYREESSIGLTKKKPTEIWEITKNKPHHEDSGNMTSQRLSKIVALEDYPHLVDVPFYYLIDHCVPLTSKDVCSTNARLLGLFQALGADILFTDQNSASVTEYAAPKVPKVLSDLEYSGRANFCNIDQHGNANIKSNFYKNKKTKKGSHDPNVGWTCGIVGLCFKLNAKSIILEANRDISKFRNNKLIKILNHYGVEVRYKGKKLTLAKNKKEQEDYWSRETTGEKLTTIGLHYWTLNNGFDPIFHNHAGCERGYVKRATSELVQPTGGKGLPDFVYADHAKKILYVIEGEREDNYLSGLKQVKNPGFLNWIKREFSTYKGYTAHVYITTNGTTSCNEDHNLYSTQKSNLHFFNKNAKPVYTVNL